MKRTTLAQMTKLNSRHKYNEQRMRETVEKMEHLMNKLSWALRRLKHDIHSNDKYLR